MSHIVRNDTVCCPAQCKSQNMLIVWVRQIDAQMVFENNSRRLCQDSVE